ncbi:hypothetical protein Patl1_18669 [Pistacia atlantica]|uniref:Uncharacterized protein n=1 Tax=Pistacia atlantica TaxID=434234 RepID=A0ACC1C231_9ROSI|nr:hypothetical protein Patl1_18669 [Pistacia atlantica]
MVTAGRRVISQRIFYGHPSGNSEISRVNDVIESKKDVPSAEKKVVNNKVGVSVGGNSIYCDKDNTKVQYFKTYDPATWCLYAGSTAMKLPRPVTFMEWQNEAEKEQFSPVSVLDCPFEDDKDSSSPSSPFQHRLARMEGTKQKLMQKIRRFETLAHLEPLDLEKRIALSELEDETLESPLQTLNKNILFNGDEDEAEKKVSEFLKVVRSTTQSNILMCKADNLLSDFFREWIEEEGRCKSGRRDYIKEMEKNGRFRNVKEEKEEVGLDLEVQIFTTLVNELVVDVFM